MKIVKEYPIDINEWRHDNDMRFLGRNTQMMRYELGLTHPDIYNGYYFAKVKVVNWYDNVPHGVVFSAAVTTTFIVSYEHAAPSYEFLLGLIGKAGYNYAKLFHEKTQQTSLFHHKIPKPTPQEMHDVVQKSIALWDSDEQEFLEEKRKTMYTFPGLPEIPDAKRYFTSRNTREQYISNQISIGATVTESDIILFDGLSAFYQELNEKLKVLKYAELTATDRKLFKDYIMTAFNFQPLIVNEIFVTRVYRMVVNEHTTGKDERINDQQFLSYPKATLVKEKGIYNRANTPNYTVFYATEDFDTALKEIKPESGKLISVGIWEPKTKEAFKNYPIVHHPVAGEVNPGVMEALTHIQKLEKEFHPSFKKYIYYYLELLCSEYAKPIDHKFAYLISAIFSESILTFENSEYNFDCITYPSVGNELRTINTAFKASTIDERFALKKVIEFRIRNPRFEQLSSNDGNPEKITLADAYGVWETDRIRSDGKIYWNTATHKDESKSEQ